QPGNLGRSTGQVDPLNVFAGSGSAEEIKGFLNLEHDDFRDLLQDRHLGVFAHRAHLVAQFQRFGIVEAEVQFLLQRVGVLVAAHANVAGNQRRGALDDVNVDDAGGMV